MINDNDFIISGIPMQQCCGRNIIRLFCINIERNVKVKRFRDYSRFFVHHDLCSEHKIVVSVNYY